MQNLCCNKGAFQSTRPARGATTRRTMQIRRGSKFQSTRPARGATFLACCKWEQFYNISIHAPREGRDGRARWYTIPKSVFQSTRPARGATTIPKSVKQVSALISIHAPREGRDDGLAEDRVGHGISIHAPREGRDILTATDISSELRFQSTRPARGATPHIIFSSQNLVFQSTRPARGATRSRRTNIEKTAAFQSTRPARGATVRGVKLPAADAISIHAPREGRDALVLLFGEPISNISIHAPREGRDRLQR